MAIWDHIYVNDEDRAEMEQHIQETLAADARRAEQDAEFWAWVTRGCKADDPYLARDEAGDAK